MVTPVANGLPHLSVDGFDEGKLGTEQARHGNTCTAVVLLVGCDHSSFVPLAAPCTGAIRVLQLRFCRTSGMKEAGGISSNPAYSNQQNDQNQVKSGRAASARPHLVKSLAPCRSYRPEMHHVHTSPPSHCCTA
jgi:hypothetical protein